MTAGKSGMTKEVYTNKKRCILVQISGSKGEGLQSLVANEDLFFDGKEQKKKNTQDTSIRNLKFKVPYE